MLLCCLQEEGLYTDQCSEPTDRQDKSPTLSVRDRCWLCQSVRKDEEDSDNGDFVIFSLWATMVKINLNLNADCIY